MGTPKAMVEYRNRSFTLHLSREQSSLPAHQALLVGEQFRRSECPGSFDLYIVEMDVTRHALAVLHHRRLPSNADATNKVTE